MSDKRSRRPAQLDLEQQLNILLNHASKKLEQGDIMSHIEEFITPIDVPFFVFENIGGNMDCFIKPVQLQGEKHSYMKVHEMEAKQLKAKVYSDQASLDNAQVEIIKAKEHVLFKDQKLGDTDDKYSEIVQEVLAEAFKLEFKAENGKDFENDDALALMGKYTQICKMIPNNKELRERLFIPLIESMNNTMDLIKEKGLIHREERDPENLFDQVE